MKRQKTGYSTKGSDLSKKKQEKKLKASKSNRKNRAKKKININNYK